MSPVRSPRSRPGRRPEGRAAILAAAEQIFAELGLDGARTEAIAERAGVNKALLYYYFRSKHALFRAVLEDQLQKAGTQINEILDSRETVRARLVKFMSLRFDFVEAHPYFPRLMHWFLSSGPRTSDRLLRRYWAPLYRKLLAVIREGVRCGELRRVEPYCAAHALLGLSAFYFSAAPMIKRVSHVDPLAPANLRRAKHELIEFMRHGLFRHPEARVL
jgi:TetR/AcrR family transcriptional regulator